MKKVEFYKNYPLVRGSFFHFQTFNKRFWIEIPFIGVTFKF